MYHDAPDVNVNPNHLEKETRVLTKKDLVTVRLASGGGMVMHLKKQ